jgi:adenosylcobyric acid synthase
MLGRTIRDPEGIEGTPGERPGLGLLDVETVLSGEKTLIAASGTDVLTGAPVHGYEMHVGVTTGPGTHRPMLHLGQRTDGAVAADGRVMGCYLHGLFSSDAFRQAFLGRLRSRAASGTAYEAGIERVLDDLAGHLAQHLDVDRILALAEPPALPRAS